MTRGATVEVKCKWCKEPFTARVADRNRGWGKFCSKSCKAKKQEARTGQHLNYRHSGVDRSTYLADAKEYGGEPQYDRRGVYVGFSMNEAELASGGYGDKDR